MALLFVLWNTGEWWLDQRQANNLRRPVVQPRFRHRFGRRKGTSRVGKEGYFPDITDSRAVDWRQGVHPRGSELEDDGAGDGGRREVVGQQVQPVRRCL